MLWSNKMMFLEARKGSGLSFRSFFVSGIVDEFFFLSILPGKTHSMKINGCSGCFIKDLPDARR